MLWSKIIKHQRTYIIIQGDISTYVTMKLVMNGFETANISKIVTLKTTAAHLVQEAS